MPLRISIISNSAFVNTGYGVQARLLAKRLHAAGYPTAIQAFYGLEGAMLLWEDGIPLYPRAYHPYGSDVMAAHARHFKADLLLSLMDAWVLDPRMLGGVPWVAWAPVDMEPLPPPVLNHLRHAYQFVAMSRFGVRMAEDAGLPSVYVPHSVETNVYTPGDRVEARERLGLPRDAFIVGIVAANKGNPSRKAWPQMLEAFARFKRRHSDAVLYCHTTKGSHGENGGVNLPELVEYLGLSHTEQGRPEANGADVVFADQYLGVLGLNDEHMVTLYRAFDVKMIASMGEGFCYAPGARVMTQTGTKPIEDIATQDLVVTHRGHLRDVEQVMKRLVIDEPMVTIRALGNNQTQTVTREHPVFALKRQWQTFTGVRRALARGDARLDWLRAGDLEPGDFLLVPQRAMAPLTYDSVDLGQYVPVDSDNLTSRYRNRGATAVTARTVAALAGVSPHTAQRVLGSYELAHVATETQERVRVAAGELGWEPLPHVSRFLPLTEDTGYFFGQYLAEGSLGSNGQIEFASHASQTDVRERLRRIAADVWGFDAWERVRGNGAELVVSCKPLADAIRATCGKGAHHKHLPSFVFDNPDFARGLLIGAWIGDGAFGPVHPTYSTSSEQLAYGMRQLTSSFGFHATIQQTKRGDWSVGIAGAQADAFLALFGKSDREKVKRQRVIPIDGGWLVPIESVETQRYTGYVYNLEVADDHSYCVEGFATHNCVPLIEAQSCGTPVITGGWTAMDELCFAGWRIPREEADPFWTALGAYQFLPRVGAIVEALETAYDQLSNEKLRLKLSRKARSGALDYDADRVFERYWRPVLADLEQRIRAGAPLAVGGAA